jgi:hypothetical protein
MSDLLFITKIPEQNHVTTLKQIREILCMTTAAATMQDAQQVFQTFKEHKFSFVGLFEDSAALNAARDQLEDWRYETKVNLEIEKKQEIAVAKRFAVREVPDPEPEPSKPAIGGGAQEVALVLMANCDGNPLQAAALAIALARVAGNADMYEAVVMVLRNAFPWLTEMMRHQEMLVES